MKAPKNSRSVALVMLGVVMSIGVVAFALQATGAATPTLAAPTIGLKPANPAASTSATFTFTGPALATFQCQLDSAAFATCTTPKSYSALTPGAHAFAVRAVSGSLLSASTSYGWTIDTSPPPAPIINSKPAALSNTTSPSLSFADAESGVTFRCSLDGPPMASCTSSRSYSGLAQGAHTFGVQALDAAGNISATTSWSWSMDTVAPPAAVLIGNPSDPTFNATNSFTWTETDATARSQCSVENGAWFACSSPYAYVIVTTNYGLHQFAVRAIDPTGNVSSATSYSFKYEKGLPTSGLPFTISGSVSGLSIGVWKPIAVTLTNPNNVIIYVSALNVAIAADSTVPGCPTSTNIELEQSNVSTSLTVAVPANQTIGLPAFVMQPRIRLKNLSTNQDFCKGKSFTLTYSGTANN